MSLSIGIVGLPNVGKSTLFNALLKQQAALAANYPFATIEPNVGVVPVPDQRLEKTAAVVQKSEKLEQLPPIKPATVEFVDIAGLVKGAHEGEGLGNKFLAHIREVDLICHVLRDFSDANVLREGSVDAKTDRETIELELLLADLATLEKQKQPKASKDKVELQRWEIITQFIENARSGKLISQSLKTAAAEQVAKELNLLTAKKILYVINVDENQVENASSLMKTWAEKLAVSEEAVVIISAQIESELAGLDEVDQQLYLEDLGLEASGLERLIQRAYQQLQLQSFLTAGEKEVRAWTVKAGATAPEAAGVIHTDFTKNFIKARVVDYEDFIKCSGWKGAKEVGKMRLEGRDYQVQEGDVMEFMVGQ
jgi:GTP-binding protein YchF